MQCSLSLHACLDYSGTWSQPAGTTLLPAVSLHTHRLHSHQHTHRPPEHISEVHPNLWGPGSVRQHRPQCRLRVGRAGHTHFGLLLRVCLGHRNRCGVIQQLCVLALSRHVSRLRPADMSSLDACVCHCGWVISQPPASLIQSSLRQAPGLETSQRCLSGPGLQSLAELQRRPKACTSSQS